MKILYFDYWTKGIRNFRDIHSYLSTNGHNCSMLHIGSWREVVSKEEFLDGIACKDISFYKTNSIYKALKEEKPDVVVSLNTSYIVDRILIQSCRLLGIRSVFMMHGETSYTEQDVAQSIAVSSASYNSFMKKISKAKKYFSKIIP